MTEQSSKQLESSKIT